MIRDNFQIKYMKGVFIARSLQTYLKMEGGESKTNPEDS